MYEGGENCSGWMGVSEGFLRSVSLLSDIKSAISRLLSNGIRQPMGRPTSGQFGKQRREGVKRERATDLTGSAAQAKNV